MWRDPWKGSWGLPFIWTALPDYGVNSDTFSIRLLPISLTLKNVFLQGDQGIKGNLSEIQGIPFEAPPLSPVPESMRETFDPATQAIGVGYTPEGLDQNPAFYELLQEAAFKTAPEPHIKEWLVKRAHRRYGLTAMDADVKQAWYDLGLSGYGPLPNRSVAPVSARCLSLQIHRRL